MTKQEEQFVLMAILKHGSAWDAYRHIKMITGMFKETCLLREYLGMTDEAHD